VLSSALKRDLDGCAAACALTAQAIRLKITSEFNIMANWYGSGRSNYVRIKDREAFLRWADSLPDVEVVDKDDTFALLATGEGCWPSFRGDDKEELDLATEIAAHLAEGEVFIFQEVGAEKLRYLTGWAKAVNSSGETLEVSIDDIYTLVRERWNCIPTEAQY
jgi:hypothetical protein